MLNLPLTESDTLDFKRDWSSPEGALRDLAAFANTRGGTVILGIEDDGETAGGFDPGDAEELRIVSMVVDSLRLTPDVSREQTSDGQVVFILTVRPSTALVSYRGRYYVRAGKRNAEMTPEDLAARALRSGGQTWDALPTGQTFGLDGRAPTIDPAALESFLTLSKTRLPNAQPDDPQRLTLENLNLVVDGQPSRAALLLFGRQPQRTASGTGVQVAQFKDGHLIQDRTIGGPLVTQLDEVLDTLRIYLGVGYAIGDRAALEGRTDLSLTERLQRAERWPYPLDALREAVLNALIHRDYHSGDRVQIRVDTDQLSVWNPGGLLPGVSVESLERPGHPSSKRNPHIAEAFYQMGLVERWGTGTTRMIQAMQQAGLPAPTFEEDSGGFRVTLRVDLFPPERLAGLNDRQRQAIDFLRQNASITNAQYREVTDAPDRTASLDLKKLVELGFLIREGTGRTAKYVLTTGRNPQ